MWRVTWLSVPRKSHQQRVFVGVSTYSGPNTGLPVATNGRGRPPTRPVLSPPASTALLVPFDRFGESRPLERLEGRPVRDRPPGRAFSAAESPTCRFLLMGFGNARRVREEGAKVCLRMPQRVVTGQTP